MAKISQARKALKAQKGYRKVSSTAAGDFAKYPGESDRPAIDSGVDVASIDAAFAPPADDSKPAESDEPANQPKPTKTAKPAAKPTGK